MFTGSILATEDITFNSAKDGRTCTLLESYEYDVRPVVDSSDTYSVEGRMVYGTLGQQKVIRKWISQSDLRQWFDEKKVIILHY